MKQPRYGSFAISHFLTLVMMQYWLLVVVLGWGGGGLVGDSGGLFWRSATGFTTIVIQSFLIEEARHCYNYDCYAIIIIIAIIVLIVEIHLGFYGIRDSKLQASWAQLGPS